MIQRLVQIVIKEFIQLKNNPDMIRMIIILPVFQMLIFGYAAVLDVKNIDTAILDKDRSSLSREIESNFQTTKYFNIKYLASTEHEISTLLDYGDILIGIIIPPDFSKKIKEGETADVQLLIDGTNSSAANIVANYGASTVISFSNEILKKRGLDIKNFGTISLESRFLYNPSLDNRFFFLPGIFGMIILVLGMPITARAIVREKEMGTLEQIIVTPITPVELIIGKVVPYTLLTIISSTGILLINHIWFNMPFEGNIAILYGIILLFLINAFGIGIFISSISNTQQQAMLTCFFVTMPMILFSGFVFPVENMPIVFQQLTRINSMYYFLRCIRDICLKGSGLEYLAGDLIALGALGIIVFIASIASFKKRMD